MDGSTRTKILSLSYCWWWIVKGPILCPLTEHVPACATASFLVQTCQYSVEIRHLEVSQILVLLLADCYWWLHFFCKPTKNPWSAYIYYIYISIYLYIYIYICGDKTTELLCPPRWGLAKASEVMIDNMWSQKKKFKKGQCLHWNLNWWNRNNPPSCEFSCPHWTNCMDIFVKKNNFIIYSNGNDQLWDQLNFVFFWAGICYKST